MKTSPLFAAFIGIGSFGLFLFFLLLLGWAIRGKRRKRIEEKEEEMEKKVEEEEVAYGYAAVLLLRAKQRMEDAREVAG